MRFANIEPTKAKTIWDILKWKITSQRAQWPKRIDYGPTDKPPASVSDGSLRLSFVNHATVLLQTRGLNILTDPVWSDRVSPFSFAGPKRVHMPGIAWDDLPRIDLVLISHSHYDHLDIATVRNLALRDDPLFIVPVGVDRIIRRHVPAARLMTLSWHETHRHDDALTIHAVPSQHWSSRRPFDRNRTLWCGYVLDLPGGKIYFAGDTGYGTGRVFRDIHARYGAMRFALIPIGAYAPRWFMKDAHANPEEAVRIFQDVQAQHASAMHWGTFQLTDEGADAPVKALQSALQQAAVDPLCFRCLTPGQAWLLG